MIRYTIRQVFIFIQLLFGISIVVFILASLFPGDPIANLFGRYDLVWNSGRDLEEVQRQLGGETQAGVRGPWPVPAELQHRFGGETPGPVRYLFWMKEVLTGNLGISIQSSRPVTEIIRDATPLTMVLVAVALAVASIVGMAIGVLSARFQRSTLVRLAGTFPIILASVPPVLFIFWGIHILVIRLGWLPAVGNTSFNLNLHFVRAAILPTLALALPCIAIYVRYARQSMLGSYAGEPKQPASGKPSWEKLRPSGHVFRSVGVPLLRNLSLSLPPLLGGTLVVESMVPSPGLGGLAIRSLVERDYPVQTATLLAVAVTVLAARLLTDLIYGWLDPSVRGSAQGFLPTPGEAATASHGAAAARQIGPPLELIDRPIEHRPWNTARRRFLASRPAVAGLVILLGFVAFAILGPVAAPYGPDDSLPLQPMMDPSASHWLGTDRYGRDVFSLVLHGARTALSVGVMAAAISLAIGCIVGGIAGRFGGRGDGILMRMTDLVMTFPALFLMVSILGVFWPGNTALVIGVISWPGIARLIRRHVLVQHHSGDFADSLVEGDDRRDLRLRAARRLAGPVAVAVAYSLAGALLTDVTLSFLGLGNPFPAVNWGQMIGQSGLLTNPVGLVPAILIVLLVLSVHLVGDGLRNAFATGSRDSDVAGSGNDQAAPAL